MLQVHWKTIVNVFTKSFQKKYLETGMFIDSLKLVNGFQKKYPLDNTNY